MCSKVEGPWASRQLHASAGSDGRAPLGEWSEGWLSQHGSPSPRAAWREGWCVSACVERPASSGPGTEQPVGFPTIVLPSPAPWASGVRMDGVSTVPPSLASMGMFETLLCLSVEMRRGKREEGHGSVNEPLEGADGRLGLERGTYGARRTEVRVPHGAKCP